MENMEIVNKQNVKNLIHELEYLNTEVLEKIEKQKDELEEINKSISFQIAEAKKILQNDRDLIDNTVSAMQKLSELKTFDADTVALAIKNEYIEIQDNLKADFNTLSLKLANNYYDINKKLNKELTIAKNTIIDNINTMQENEDLMLERLRKIQKFNYMAMGAGGFILGVLLVTVLFGLLKLGV